MGVMISSTEEGVGSSWEIASSAHTGFPISERPASAIRRETEKINPSLFCPGKGVKKLGCKKAFLIVHLLHIRFFVHLSPVTGSLEPTFMFGVRAYS